LYSNDDVQSVLQLQDTRFFRFCSICLLRKSSQIWDIFEKYAEKEEIHVTFKNRRFLKNSSSKLLVVRGSLKNQTVGNFANFIFDLKWLVSEILTKNRFCSLFFQRTKPAILPEGTFIMFIKKYVITSIYIFSFSAIISFLNSNLIGLDSKQPLALKISYSWHNSETIFPFPKFYPKLSF